MAQEKSIESNDIPIEVGGIFGRPVTKWEKWAFYMFGFATEPFYATAMGVTIPIILETLAATSGYEYDLKTPCDLTKAYQCKVNLAGTWYDTSAFTLYTTAISVAIQVLVFISLSSIADYGNHRKFMLLFTAFLSGVFCILFLTVVRSDLYWLAAIYAIIGNVMFGASYVFFYAYVPTLTTFSPEVLTAVNQNQSDEEILKVREHVGNDISSKGFAAGYFGAVVSLIISAGMIYGLGDVGPTSTYPLQIVSGFIGVWILVFLVFTFRWLENRPGTPLPQGENYFIYSWKQLRFTLSHIRQLSQTFLFLLSWFIMSDSVSTIVSISVIFAKKDLGLTLFELLISAIIIPIAAFVGCLFWNFVRAKLNLTTKFMVILLSILYFIPPIYGLIGLTPGITWGMKNKVEVYILCAYHGFLLGAVQSFYRVMFSEMLPSGKENEFFGLYEVTDKGSSWIGPLVCGAIADVTGQIRLGFFFIIGTMVIAVVIAWFVDPKKGIAQAREFERQEKLAELAKVELEEL